MFFQRLFKFSIHVWIVHLDCRAVWVLTSFPITHALKCLELKHFIPLWLWKCLWAKPSKIAEKKHIMFCILKHFSYQCWLSWYQCAKSIAPVIKAVCLFEMTVVCTSALGPSIFWMLHPALFSMAGDIQNLYFCLRIFFFALVFLLVLLHLFSYLKAH